MSAASHTTINVAVQSKVRKQFGSDKPSYEHFFAVNIDRHPAFCQEQIREIQKKFPAPKYEVDITYWECIGHAVNPVSIEVAE